MNVGTRDASGEDNATLNHNRSISVKLSTGVNFVHWPAITTSTTTVHAQGDSSQADEDILLSRHLLNHGSAGGIFAVKNPQEEL